MDITGTVSASSLRCCTLASGSKGNSIFIGSGSSGILVDAGLSYARLTDSLACRGLSVNDVDALVITHEHADHIKGAGVFARKSGLPVYLTEQTFSHVRDKFDGTETIRHFAAGGAFSVGELRIEPFSTLHDAADPVGLAVSCGTKKIGIATDLGHVTTLVREKLKGAQALVLEFNHDEDLLHNNRRYPWPLKQRIRSNHGHLSNNAARQFLRELMHDGLRYVLAAHLSAENNEHTLVAEILENLGAAPDRPEMIVCGQDAVSKLIEI